MTAVTLVAILTTGYIALWASGDSLRMQRESMSATLAAAVARSVTAEWILHPVTALPERRANLRALLRSLAETTDALGLSVIGLDRVEIASWPQRRDRDGDAAVISTALAGGPPVINYRPSPQGRDEELLAYAPIEFGGRVVGAVRVAMAASEPTKSVLRRSGLLLLLLALADAFAVSVEMQRAAAARGR